VRPLRNIFYKLSRTEQRREGVAAYLCPRYSAESTQTLFNKNINIFVINGFCYEKLAASFYSFVITSVRIAELLKVRNFQTTTNLK
jgi:hypothetical protein